MNCCNDNGECTRGHGCPWDAECKVKATSDCGVCFTEDPHAPMTAMDRLAIVAMVVASCAIVGGSFGFFYSLFKTRG
jgi:hypothetical protein